MKGTKAALCLTVALALVACGGSKADPATPESGSPAASESVAKAESGPSLTNATATQPAAAPPEEPAAAAAPAAISPKEVLLQEDAVFLLNFRKSDIGKKTEEECTRTSEDDPAKKARCMTQALGQVRREGISFEEKPEGVLWYVRFGIDKGKQVVLSRVKAEVGESKGSTFTLKTSGGDNVPAELIFEMPDQYTLVYDHPKNGKMVYELRFDLIENK